MPPVDFNLYLITDRHVIPSGRTLVEQVRGALEGGVRAIQLREKDLTAAQLYPLALELRILTRYHAAKLLINDRIDIALAVDADGVHLGGHSLPVVAARALVGPDRLIGVSTHHLDEIGNAKSAGADFVTFGPIYPTPSKLSLGLPLGPALLQQACASPPLPIFALGGVSDAKITEMTACGCRHFACIAAILQSPAPSSAARTLLNKTK